MTVSRSIFGIFLLACFVSQACAQGSYLDPSNGMENRAAKDEIGSSMQSEIFNIGSYGKVSSNAPYSAPGMIRLGGQQSELQSPAKLSPAPQAFASVAGRWKMDMADTTSRVAELTLYQSENAVFGMGKMTSGNNTRDVAASGSVKGREFLLDIVSTGDMSMYRLSMALVDGSASGDYNAFSASDQAAQSGTVRGLKSA